MDNRNTRLDRGNLDGIRRHFTALNYVYDLPFGRGKRFGSSLSGFAGKLLEGWQIAGISSFGTANPFPSHSRAQRWDGPAAERISSATQG